MTDNVAILLDESRGIYIPKNFVDEFDIAKWNVSAKDAEILSRGPEDELYWDAWHNVLDNAWYVDKEGTRWRLYQDGTLFAYKEDEFPFGED